MLYALLLLGLIPVALLPDYLAEQDDGEDRGGEPEERLDTPTNLLDVLPESTDQALEPVVEDDPPGDPEEDEAALPPVVEDDEPEPEVTVLDPVIEDDEPGAPPTGDPDEVLAPVIEDDADPAYPEPDPDDVLPPVIEDDVASDGADSEPLSPVQDLLAGDGGAWLNASDLAAGSYAEISGFEAGTDVLHITFDPDYELPDFDVTIGPSDDGADSEVLVGGTLIAILLDAPDVPIEDIIVILQQLQ